MIANNTRKKKYLEVYISPHSLPKQIFEIFSFPEHIPEYNG